MRLKINKMEHFHYRNIGQIGHFFMNFHYARYEKVKKSVPPNIKNEASDHRNHFPKLLKSVKIDFSSSFFGKQN